MRETFTFVVIIKSKNTADRLHTCGRYSFLICYNLHYSNYTRAQKQVRLGFPTAPQYCYLHAVTKLCWLTSKDLGLILRQHKIYRNSLYETSGHTNNILGIISLHRSYTGRSNSDLITKGPFFRLALLHSCNILQDQIIKQVRY